MKNLIGLICLLFTISLIGCSWDMFGLDRSVYRYKQEKACRDTMTGKYVEQELCR